MKSRILVALIFIPLLFYILYTGGPLLLLFTNVIIGVSLHEYYNMMENGGRTPYRKLGMTAGLAIPNILYMSQLGILETDLVLLAIVLIFMGTTVERVFTSKVADSSLDVGGTILGVVYTSVLFSHIILISGLPNGNLWILAAQIMVWVCDSMAYFVGLATGRKVFKEGLCPVSPKKSKEGSIGGVFFTVVALIIMKANLLKRVDAGLMELVIVAIGVAVVAQVGDLVESLFKREFKVKDSSNILGEHGGMLDRFDSMIFVIPALYYILKYIVI